MHWSDKLRSWLLHVELVARGAEPLRQTALDALERGHARQARLLSFRLLHEVPDSPLGLTIWADAAEALLLDEEVAEALERLARRVPYRADVALRLAQALERLGKDPSAAWQKAIESGEPLDAVEEAGVRLLERALDARDLVKSVALASSLRAVANPSARARFRLVEADLLTGDVEAARRSAGDARPDLLDARGWLTWARAQSKADDEGVIEALERALILDSTLSVPVAEFLAQPSARGLCESLLPLVAELGLSDSPEWQVARALADSDPSRALSVLESHALREGTALAGLRWLEAALAARDLDALSRALNAGLVDRLEARGSLQSVADAHALLEASRAPDGDRLQLLDGVSGPGLAWADELRQQVYARWLGECGTRGWELVIGQIEALARDCLDLNALKETASVRLDLERPLRVAVVGAFNAGKSSLINALLGHAVVPVGILPTTATVNRLRWAPDRFARIDFRDVQRPVRVLDHATLAPTLAEEDPAAIESVSIFAPLEPLRQLEIIDTPGFNADRAGHEATALAVGLEAHLLLWVVDATAGLRASDVKNLSLLSPEQTPVLVVVNKCDRLTVAEQEEVMAQLHEELGALELRLLRPPVAISARLAQRGQERGALDALIDSIREATPDLKAAGLARQALRIVMGLQSAQQGEDTDAAGPIEQALSRLTRGSEALRAAWVAELEGALRELWLELRPILGADHAGRSYVAQRARAVLGARLFALVSGSLELNSLPPELRGALWTGLHGLARGLSVALEPEGAAPERALAARVAALLHGETQALLEAWPRGQPDSSATEAARSRRLEALRRALGSS